MHSDNPAQRHRTGPCASPEPTVNPGLIPALLGTGLLLAYGLWQMERMVRRRRELDPGSG
jgi:hypothetical protein